MGPVVIYILVLVLPVLTEDIGCHFNEDDAFKESANACLNITLSGPLRPALSETANDFFEMPMLNLQFVTGTVDNRTFQHFSHLRSLRVGSCHLESLKPHLDTLEALRILESYAKFESIDQISKSLTKLTLRNSSGFDLSPGIFKNLNRLRSLHLSHITIPRINKDLLRGLKSLKVLRIEEINLEAIDDDAFQDLVKLKELYIEDNNLENLSGNIFKPLSKLRTLSISGRKLKPLSLDLFTEQRNLNQLSWPSSTWRAIDTNKVPRMFPKLYSLSYYSRNGSEDVDIQKTFSQLNKILMNRNI